MFVPGLKIVHKLYQKEVSYRTENPAFWTLAEAYVS